MEAEAGEDLDGPELRRRADLRYRGQSFELTVEADDLDGVQERFAEAHERRYGYRMEGEDIELVNARVVATLPVEKPELAAEEAEGDAEAGERKANFDGDWSEVPVYRRAGMGEGFAVEGPAIVEFAEATCVVRPGWSGAVDSTGTLVLER
jgi:N-methylhydantoinase A